jgi:hypothetical protein
MRFQPCARGARDILVEQNPQDDLRHG